MLMIILLPLMLVLTGCSLVSSNIEFRPAGGLKDIALSSRPVPATVTAEPEESLDQKDFLLIGSLEKVKVLETCYNSEFGHECDASLVCMHETKDYAFTKELIEKAASYGADVVKISKDNALEKGYTGKKGKCTQTRSIEQHVQVQSTAGAPWVWKWQRVDICTAWTTIGGRACEVVSAVSLWRRESVEFIRKIKFNSVKELWEESWPKVTASSAWQQLNETPYMVSDGKKYGYKAEKSDAQFIIPPRFKDANRFSEGLAAVSVIENDNNEAWGFIDKTGKWIIQPSYKKAMSYYEGLAVVKLKNNKSGYIDNQGNMVIKAEFDEAYRFVHGVAKVKVGGKYGFINKSGKLLLEP
jgi:hypothetical protein